MAIQFEEVMAQLQQLISEAGTSKLGFDPASVLQPWAEGLAQYDPVSGGHVLDTKYSGVRLNAGREMHVEIFNDTGALISNGDPISRGKTLVDGITTGVPSDSSDSSKVLTFIGIATMDIPDQEKGIITTFGEVNDVDTQDLTAGFIYMDDAGWYTQTRPLYPLSRVIIGAVLEVSSGPGVADGKLLIAPVSLPRTNASRSFHFSSGDSAAGLHDIGGFYDFSTTSVTLTQASLTITHGAANISKAAHPTILVEAAGTVDTGQVGLRVTGTCDSEGGIQIADQTEVITEDITTLDPLSTNEVLKKFSGTLTYELYVVSGTPVNYDLTFNYGYSSYEDFSNNDGTITSLDCTWEGGANDTDSNIILRKHTNLGWTFASTGFVPGDGSICERLTDQAINPGIAIGENGRYKRTNLNEFVEGSGLEGIIVQIYAGSNNTFRNLTAHVIGWSEGIT